MNPSLNQYMFSGKMFMSQGMRKQTMESLLHDFGKTAFLRIFQME